MLAAHWHVGVHRQARGARRAGGQRRRIRSWRC